VIVKSLLAIAVFGAVLSACGGSTPQAKAPAKCPPQNVTIALVASKGVNPTGKDARPVVVRIYQLKNDAKLMNASFDAIWNQDKATLGDDLVKVDEVELYPSTRKDVKFTRPDTVMNLAAVALFQNPTGRSWVSTVDLPPPAEGGKCYAEGIDPDDVDDRPVQNPVLSFWLDGARIDDGAEHVEDCPRPGPCATEQKKPVLRKAAPEKRP
jgi:type VI secretion system protein VasD